MVMEETAKKISHYEILELLGEGGMGAVYKARNIENDKISAIKILSSKSIQSEELKRRFIREAQTGMRLDHPNIVKIYEVGEEDGNHFISMEYVEGKTLRRLLENGPLEPAKVIEIGIAAAEALGNAHSASVVHRDIKSENIMLTTDGIIKVMDFGLAKVQDASILTIEGSILGTISYMSPQQAIGEAIDNRSDIFSLGVVLYELLTNRLPFLGDYEMAVIYSILNEEPLSIREINNEVPKSLEQIVFKALRKDPNKRQHDANELIEELKNVKKIIESGIQFEEETSKIEETFISEERGFQAKLAGRDLYLDKLKGILHRASVGSGHIVFVTGEAGIGKTRLVLELEKYARTLKARTLKSRCFFNQGVYPYQPFVDALRSYFEIKGVEDSEKLELFLNQNAPELLSVLPVIKLFLNIKTSDQLIIENKEQIWDAIFQLLIIISKERPLVLFIDDLHWADEDTLNLLYYIGRNSVNRRILLIGTYRPEDLTIPVGGKSNKILEIKHELGKEGILSKIELTRLTAEDIFSITSSLFVNAQFDESFYQLLFNETEGNPFFVIETLKLLKLEEVIYKSGENYFLKENYHQISIPSKVQDIIMKRIERIEEKDRELLEIGAVEGESFHSDIIKYCLEINKLELLRKLQSLEREHHIIHPADKMYRFDHAKIREALYDSISPELKSEYHLLIAQYFIDNFKEDEIQAPNIAQHLLRSGEEVRALPFIITAAKRAKMVFANEQSIYFYQKAKEIILKNEAVPTQDIIKQKQFIYEDMGDVLALIGKYDSSLENYNNITITNETPLQLQTELNWKKGNVYLSKGENDKALETFELAENIIEKYLNTAKKEENTSGKLNLDFDVEDLLNALGKIKISKAQVFKSSGEYNTAQKEINDGLVLLKEDGNYLEKGQAYNNLGNILFDLGNYENSEAMYKKSLELREKILDKKGIAESYNNLSIVYCDGGEYQKAAESLERSISIMKEIGFRVGIAGTSLNLGAIYQDQGKYIEASQLYKKVLDISNDIVNIPLKILAYSNLGSVDIDLKNYDDAIKYLKESLSLIEKINAKNFEPQIRSWLSTALLESGKIEDAMEAALKSETIALCLSQKAGLGFAKRAIAAVELKQLISNENGDPFEVNFKKIEGLLKECKEIFEELKMKHELGRNYVLAARFYFKTNNLREGQNYMNMAKELFKKLGAEGDLKKLEELNI
jgi:predicted ATPase/tRNA A-37 threonylcarbamoyl transferase component Bud32